jgi:cbb3-type cytochrome oxidase subunit 1
VTTSPKICEVCKFWITTIGILVYVLTVFLAKQVQIKYDIPVRNNGTGMGKEKSHQ